MVIDMLSKYAHFIVLFQPFSAMKGAHVYLDQIYTLHGFPQYIISDKDKIFIGQFLTELLKL